jgi:acetylornithine/N-succinyldiaminopimelate aminotransferase
MISHRQLFLNNLAQTSDLPLMLEVSRAEGSFLFDQDGKPYLDLISGISVSNLGHQNPVILKAIREQLDKYLHVMVYGEFVQNPQVDFATLLVKHLPDNLDSVYFTNSGTEATEGAMKLAKRFTGRTEIISFKNAYHGSTQGALSISGDENLKNSFRPLIPGSRMLRYNNFHDLENISKNTAAVFIEAIQGEAGALLPVPGFLKAVEEKCRATGALLVVDEIQSGMGRTGDLFAFMHENIFPDILLLGKAFGGGLPLGAFISSREIMATLKFNPVLGHITTFGGHPLCCAAGLAAFSFLLENNIPEQVKEKEKLFREKLQHQKIREIIGRGILLAIYLDDFEQVHKTIRNCFDKGLISDWFLFNSNAMRLAPPLTISEDEILSASEIILKSLDD